MTKKNQKEFTSPEYRAWQNMKQRCYNSNNSDTHRYKERGITVCASWRDSYYDFLADMGRRPGPHYSIDRIDNDGNYEPGNCRWATSTVQKNNSSNVLEARKFEHNGKNLTLAEWSKETGISKKTLNSRTNRGWPVEKVLTTPPGKTYGPTPTRYSCGGKSLTVLEWAEELGVKPSTIDTRLQRGWSIEKTFSKR